MKTRVINGVEVTRSSGNVFADLGLPDAEQLKLKTDLVIAIRKAIAKQKRTQPESAKRKGVVPSNHAG